MRITYFRIENFKSIKLAECTDPPDFMVIGGANGSGKSALLSALAAAKESAGSYGSGPHVASVSADSDSCRVKLTLEFDEVEQAFLRQPPPSSQFAQQLSPFSGSSAMIELTQPRIRIGQEQQSQSRCPDGVRRLLSSYSQEPGSPGFFDYIDAHRLFPPTPMSGWEPQLLNDQITKSTLVMPGLHQVNQLHGNQLGKFLMTKRYLAGCVMNDLIDIQKSRRAGVQTVTDSLVKFRELFAEFLSPLEFVEVDISETPFRFIVKAPMGEIDIDDLSSGEKEIMNVLARFLQLRPQRSIILDEADAHLHPDLQRRYLALLKRFSIGNQLWITTHSPEMMIAAGSSHLYALTKKPSTNSNQFLRVTENQQLHDALSEIMGTRGVVTFNQTVVFIEGDESSADLAIYEGLYPPSRHNVSFVPVGNSGTVRKTSERVNQLLTHTTGFQSFYSIVDRDIDRSESDPTGGTRLLRLPVYHVENFLLEEDAMLKSTRSMLGVKSPYQNTSEITKRLTECLLSDLHLKPFTKALLDAKLSLLAKQASDAVFSGKDFPEFNRPAYLAVEQEARDLLTKAINNNEWKAKCKGRDLLKAYCKELTLPYEYFRNLLIENVKPPTMLDELMQVILHRAKA